MKCLLALLLCAFAIRTIGQSGQRKEESINPFVLFAGISIHAAYTGANSDAYVYLNRAISPGVELGVRFRKTVLPGFDAGASAGVDFALIRNRILTLLRTTKGFDSGEHYYGFLEGGLYCRTGIFKDALKIFVGYRVNLALTTTYGYGEQNSEYILGIESTVNPATKLFHSIVIRPEFVVNSQKTQGKFIIGLQAVLGAGVSSSDLVQGTYYYKSNLVEGTGNVYGNFAHVTLLGQIYL